MEEKKRLTREIVKDIIKNNPNIKSIDNDVLKIIIEEASIDESDFEEQVLHKLKVSGVNMSEEQDLCKIKINNANNDKLGRGDWFIIGMCIGGAICYYMM